MAEPLIPRDAERIGSVTSFATERGWAGVIRDALLLMFSPKSHAEAALRLGRVDVYLHRGLRTTGGFFKCYREGPPIGIFLNAAWFTKPETLRQTFLHEVAHAAVYIAGHPLDHGPKWRGFMEAMGLEPLVRHHEHDLVGAFWVAFCPSCGLVLEESRRTRRPKARRYGHWTCPVDPETTVEWLWAGPTGKR
jgi:predicted SprT family Zn-dependent metalloprotease